MIVDESTWEKLIKEAQVPEYLSISNLKAAAPAHLIAMKLKALSAPHRRTNNNDWSDIVELVRRIDSISLDDDGFRELVLKFGTEDLWQQLQVEVNKP